MPLQYECKCEHLWNKALLIRMYVSHGWLNIIYKKNNQPSHFKARTNNVYFWLLPMMCVTFVPYQWIWPTQKEDTLLWTTFINRLTSISLFVCSPEIYDTVTIIFICGYLIERKAKSLLYLQNKVVLRTRGWVVKVLPLLMQQKNGSQ